MLSTAQYNIDSNASFQMETFSLMPDVNPLVFADKSFQYVKLVLNSTPKYRL